MDLIPNDWKHLLRIETFQKSLLKTFYYNNKGNSLIKKFSSPFNLTNSTKYNKPSNFFSWPSILEGHHFSVLKSWVKLSLIGLKNALMDIYFLILQYIEWATH